MDEFNLITIKLTIKFKLANTIIISRINYLAEFILILLSFNLKALHLHIIINFIIIIIFRYFISMIPRIKQVNLSIKEKNFQLYFALMMDFIIT